MEALGGGRGPLTPLGLMGRVSHPGERRGTPGGGGAGTYAYDGSGVAGETCTVGSGSSRRSRGRNGEPVRGVGSKAGTGGVGSSGDGNVALRSDGLFDRRCEALCPNVVRRLRLLGTWPTVMTSDAEGPGPGDASRTVGSSSRERERMDASEYRLRARSGDFMRESAGFR